MRTYFISILLTSIFKSIGQNICGDYIKPYYTDDIFTRLTLKSDSTFDFVHHSPAIHDQKESGHWRKYGEIILLSDCKSCGPTFYHITPHPFKNKVPNQFPFDYKHISIKGDSLFLV